MATPTNVQQLERDIEYKQGEIAIVQSNIETFEYTCSEEQFNEFLDDVEQAATVYGIAFYPSDILKNCDPIAYRCAKSDYEADFDLEDCEEYRDMLSELEELEYELDDLESQLDELQSQPDDLGSED